MRRIMTSLTVAASLLLAGAASAECEGNACAAVSITWDEGAHRWLITNDDPDRTVVVELSNWGMTNTIRVGPGEGEYATIQAFTHPYRAHYE